jgi:hypothetical protein
MAQIKRKKVSNKAVRKESFKKLMHNKKFLIIASSVLAVVILAAVLIPVLIAINTKTKEKYDYFQGEASTYEVAFTENGVKHEVKFQELSYDGIRMVHEYQRDLHIFTFATDFSSFYPDKAINDGVDEDSDEYIALSRIQTDDSIFSQLCKLQYQIDEYNKKEGYVSVQLFIVDTSKASNVGLVTDSLFISNSENDQLTLFTYMDTDDLKTSYIVKEGQIERSISLNSTDKNEIKTSIINDAIAYIKNDFDDINK